MLDILSPSRLNFINEIKMSAHYDLIIAVAENESQWFDIPFGRVLYERKKIVAPKSKKGYFSQLPNDLGSYVIVKSNIKHTDLYRWLKDLSKLIKKIDIDNVQRIGVLTQYADDDTVAAILRTLLAHIQEMPNFKAKRKDRVIEIDVVGEYAENDFIEVLAKHKGNALARYLTILPSNYLTPEIYIERLEKMAQDEAWQFEYYNKEKLKQMKAGAFLAVASASDVAGIVKLSYTPQDYEKTIALVGKGVCFDTGGVSLKQPQYMFGMNDDMMGSAVALGSLLALSMQQTPYQVDCYLAITQNNIDKNAFLPNEVVTAINGKTIEIVDTDAEGRLILADTLCLASKRKPDLLIDYATLTGAAVRAIGTEYSAVFSNCYDWQQALVKYGTLCAEKVWPFPMDKDYLEALESEVADLKQCQVAGNADHILAAKFLQQFVGKEIRWLHMDLSSCKHEGGLAPMPTEVSGVGVWFTCELITRYFQQNEVE